MGAQETSGDLRTSFQGSGLGTFRRPPAKVSKAWMTAKVCQVGWNRHWTPVRVSREFWARPNAVAQRINICHVEDVAASSYGIQGLETHVQAWKLGSSLAQATLGRYSQGESTQVDAGHWADPDLRFCACTTSVWKRQGRQQALEEDCPQPSSFVCFQQLWSLPNNPRYLGT